MSEILPWTERLGSRHRLLTWLDALADFKPEYSQRIRANFCSIHVNYPEGGCYRSSFLQAEAGYQLSMLPLACHLLLSSTAARMSHRYSFTHSRPGLLYHAKYQRTCFAAAKSLWYFKMRTRRLQTAGRNIEHTYRMPSRTPTTMVYLSPSLVVRSIPSRSAFLCQGISRPIPHSIAHSTWSNLCNRIL